jgi:pilus assembly protein CpaF
MFTIIIQEKGGEQRRMVFNKPEVTIGRVQGNDIVLPKGNVSKRHARIVLKDGKFIIVDLKSTNGTYVNGRKITSPLVVKDSDKIYIGDFIVGVDEAADAAGDGPSETTTSPPGMQQSQPENRPPRPTEAQPMPSMPAGMIGGGMPPMSAPPPEPAPAPPPPRSVPPRPAPNPTAARGPMEGGREPLAPPLNGPGPGPMMPPIGPPSGEARPNRPPPGGRPGGTMPPPMAPIPPVAPVMPARDLAPPPMEHAPPMAPPMRSEPMDLRDGGGPGPGPGPMPGPGPRGPAPRPVPAPMPAPEIAPRPEPSATNVPPMGTPAPVVPLQPNNNNAGSAANKRALVGVGVKKSVARSVSMPSRRGIHIDPLDPKVVKMLDLQSNILERLRVKLDIDKIPLDRLHEEDVWQRAERATVDLVETLETSGELPKYIDQETLIKETLNEALALGPLEDLLGDDKIDEIIIDRRDRVVVGKDGQLRGSGKAFSSDDTFERVVKRLVAEAGATIDDAHPLIDLRMRDGTRLTAAVSPVAARGACLVLKKTPSTMPALSDLVSSNSLSAGMADFLATCVTARRNILVCGGPGSGKTSVVAALAAASPAGERVISVEEVAELAIGRDEWIQLETRAGNGRGPSIDLANLLETAMRLNPDRLVVGDVKGREALPLVSSLCSGIDGAIVAVSGEGAQAALNRLVTLGRITAPGAHDSALRELVAQAFEIVIHVARWADGTIKVLAIEEVTGVSEVAFDTTVLFQFGNNTFSATGTVPRFYSELEARGIPADQAVFR